MSSLKRQKEVIRYCENNDTIIKLLQEEVGSIKRLSHQYIKNGVKEQEGFPLK